MLLSPKATGSPEILLPDHHDKGVSPSDCFKQGHHHHGALALLSLSTQKGKVHVEGTHVKSSTYLSSKVLSPREMAWDYSSAEDPPRTWPCMGALQLWGTKVL